ncbi:hypothetical protein VME_45760 [Vibrio harveyi 1DA3]|nr:hypothetical protein VME_45760 [Vibrio harveyi 1DA3]
MEKFQQILDAVTEQKAATIETKEKIEAVEAKTNETTEAIEEIKDQVSTLETKIEKKSTAAEQQITPEQVNVKVNEAIREVLYRGEKAELSNFEDGLVIAKANAGIDAAAAASGMHIDAGGSTPQFGGVAVIDKWDMGIIESLREQSVLLSMLPVKKVSNMKLNKWVLTKHAGNRWTDENATNEVGTNTEANQYAKVSGSYGKIQAYPFYTREAAQDPEFDLISRLKSDVVTEIGREVATQLVRNIHSTRANTDTTNQSNAPKGILSLFDPTESIKATGTGTGERGYQYAGAVITKRAADLGADATSIIKYMNKLKTSLIPAYRSNAKWIMNENTYNILAELQDGQNRFYIRPDVSGQSAGYFLRFPDCD